MPVPAESLQVGQCYLTDGGHVRKVIRLMPDGRVGYEWRRSYSAKSPWKMGMTDRQPFAEAVERPVPCDWTPETDEEEGE